MNCSFLERFFFVFFVLVAVWGRSEATLLMSFSGKVLERNTMAGIQNVHLYLRDDLTIREATTDKKGNFNFHSLPEGNYCFTDIESTISSLPENVIPDSDVDIFTKPFKLSNGTNIANYKIFVTQGATISGKVFGEDGITTLTHTPISYTNYYFDGKVPFLKTVKTEAEGRFVISGLTGFPGGVTRLTVNCLGYPAQILAIENTLPGTRLENLAIICKAATKVTITGTVKNRENGLPVSDAYVVIFALKFDGSCMSSQNTRGTAYTDKIGTFVIRGLDTCFYELSIVADNYKDYYSDKIEISSDINELGTFEIQPFLQQNNSEEKK